MKKKPAVIRIFNFYLEGFKTMKPEKILWSIIILKPFNMFFDLHPFFFPCVLGQFKTKSDKQEYVSNELIERAINP